MFYRRLEFGATVREPSHYLNASRAPVGWVPSFSGVLTAGARTRREAQAPVRSATLGGPWLPDVSWAVRLGVLGGGRATWEALEAAVLPGSGPGWWSVRGGLPLLLSECCLTSFRILPGLPLLPGWLPVVA